MPGKITTLQQKGSDIYPRTYADAVKYDDKTSVKEKIYELENKSSGGGSSETFTRTDLTTIKVGGLDSGASVAGKTTKEVLESMLFPYQKPTVSFTITPSTTLYEIGSTVSSIKFSINVSKKSNEIKSIKIYDGSTLVTTITSGVASGGAFTYTYACSISSNTILKVEVNDGKETVSSSIQIKFANKSYYGFVPDGTTISESVIKSLQSNALYTSNKLTYNNITFTNSKVVYAYPKSYGALKSILDGNNFEYIGSYNNSTVSVNGTDYYVYVMKDPTTVSGFKQIFS